MTCGEVSEALRAYLDELLIPILGTMGYERNDVMFKRMASFSEQDRVHVRNLLPLIAQVRGYDLRQIDEKVVLCLARRVYELSRALADDPMRRLYTIPDEMLAEWPDLDRARWASVVNATEQFPWDFMPQALH